MTDPLLIEVPADRLPELEVARNRLAAAQAEYDAREEANEELPVGIPFSVRTELKNARACLALIERQVIGRTGGSNGLR